MEIGDIAGYGAIGLIKAVDQFDLTRMVKFETYAIALIRGAILEGLREEDWVPRTVRENIKVIEAVIARLESMMGRPPTDDEVARELKLDIKSYLGLCAEKERTSLVRIDKPVDTEETITIADMVRDKQVDVAAEAEDNEARRVILQAVNTLPSNERKVALCYYFGGMTYKEIGEVLRRSESRVYQLERQARKRLLNNGWLQDMACATDGTDMTQPFITHSQHRNGAHGTCQTPLDQTLTPDDEVAPSPPQDQPSALPGDNAMADTAPARYSMPELTGDPVILTGPVQIKVAYHLIKEIFENGGKVRSVRIGKQIGASSREVTSATNCLLRSKHAFARPGLNQPLVFATPIKVMTNLKGGAATLEDDLTLKPGHEYDLIALAMDRLNQAGHNGASPVPPTPHPQNTPATPAPDKLQQAINRLTRVIDDRTALAQRQRDELAATESLISEATSKLETLVAADKIVAALVKK
jgi:RNA polymerase sigma factor for flagellar operon FliA